MTRPTPSKVVLLMSAAGLGLSWSGLALASRDDAAPAGSAFGAAPRSEQVCDAPGPDRWMTCPVADGELLQALVADSASLPLPLSSMQASGDAKLSLRTFDAVVAASASPASPAPANDGEPQPHDNEQLPRGAVSARISDVALRDSEADALALVLLDDPRELGGDPAASPPSTIRATDADVSVGAGQRSIALQSAAIQPLADEPRTLPADAGAADSESLERVFASLADVLGAQLEEPPAHAAVRPATTPPAALGSSTDSAVADAVAPASPDVAARGSEPQGPALQRSSDADDIAVASSHSDKVLMALEALRSGDGAADGSRASAQPKKTVVVRHTDKVLETLALFQPKKSKRAAHACIGAPEEDAWVAVPKASAAAWGPFEPEPESAIASLGLALDIDLDLLAPVAHGPGDAATHAAAAVAPVEVEPAPAGRSSRNALGGEWVALNSTQLDEVRGGFVTDGGLKISFGIERAVYLNGNLVTTTSLNIADLSRISGGRAQVTGTGVGSLGLVQSGAGNVFLPGAISSSAAGTTIIQNSLDGQKIQTMTTIDAVVNSTGILRSINLQSSMQSAIVNSLRR